MARDPWLEAVRSEIEMLAADAETQIASMPPGVCFADLQLQDADHVLEVALGHRRESLTESELAVCRRLRDALTQLVSNEPESSSFWSTEGVRDHPKWRAIRELAAGAMQEFGPAR